MTTPYYDDGQVTIYCSKWEDTIAELPAGGFDLIFTSPPYNLGTTTGGDFPEGFGHYPVDAMYGRRGGRGKWPGAELANGYDDHEDAMPHEDYIAWQHQFFAATWPLLSDRGAIYYNHKPRVLGGMLVSPFEYVPSEMRRFVRQVVIWARAGGINFSPAFYLPTHEWIVIVARPAFRLKSKGASGIGDVWTVAQESGTPHPAPFPLQLPARAIETVAPKTVFDPYMGSGTTVVAARNAGCRAVGIERSERYCEIAVRRLAQSVMPLEIPA